MVAEKTPVAIVMAAGRSTRFLPGRNKLDAMLLGRRVLTWTLTRLYEAGIRRFLTVVPADRRPLALDEVHFPDAAVEPIVQDPPQGTADAVNRCSAVLEGYPGDVIIANGDTPAVRVETYRMLLETHQRSRADLTLLTGMIAHAGSYGVIERKGGHIVRVIEALDRSRDEQRQPAEVNLGIYVMRWSRVVSAFRVLKPHPIKGEYFLTDLVEVLAQSGRTVSAYVLEDASEAYGINTWADYHQVQEVIRRQVVTDWMAHGVHFLHPDSVIIEADVMLSGGVVIGPGVMLQGRTRVGEETVIGPWTRVRDATVGRACHIEDHCVIEEAVIGDACRIGPFARIRPGTELAERVAIGNFVELKKSRVGPGTKAMHLTYLGDAVIGESVNVGAGTITCNYDGEKKHVTVIEDGVFIGSDTQLVAPVRVGRGAYIAAGTTVTRDVPPNSLAISRVRQENKEGWAERRRRMKQRSGTPDRAPASKEEPS